MAFAFHLKVNLRHNLYYKRKDQDWSRLSLAKKIVYNAGHEAGNGYVKNVCFINFESHRNADCHYLDCAKRETRPAPAKNYIDNARGYGNPLKSGNVSQDESSCFILIQMVLAVFGKNSYGGVAA